MDRKGFTLIELVVLILVLAISAIIISSSIVKNNNKYKKENYDLSIKLIEKSIEFELKTNTDFKMDTCKDLNDCKNKEINNFLSNIDDNFILVSVEESDDKYIMRLEPSTSSIYSSLNLSSKNKKITISK